MFAGDDREDGRCAVFINDLYITNLLVAGCVGGGMEKVQKLAAGSVRGDFCFRGKLHGRVFAQHKTGFAAVGLRVDHLERNVVESLFSRFENAQIVVGSLIGPAAFAVSGSFIGETHVAGFGNVKHCRFRVSDCNPECGFRSRDCAGKRTEPGAE